MANNSLYSIKKVIWKITKGFEPKISIKKENDDHGFSNREEFLNEIVKYFKNEFEKKTTHRSILYPTSFLIYLHPSDYKIQEQDFRLTVKDAVEDFYNYINEKTKNVDYKPHAPYWLFQICSFNGIFVKNQVDEEIITVPKGEVYIISDTFPVDFSENNVFEGN
ncbi:MAG: hypothetical protein FWD71_23135, partial [Oscillospiraceae bacterium]|nr:hypothetical protein [Oscillospiraceae bacterium]